jgi:hypothetical protein
MNEKNSDKIRNENNSKMQNTYFAIFFLAIALLPIKLGVKTNKEVLESFE